MKGNDLAASSGDATVMRFRSPPRFTRRDPDCFVEEGEVWEIEYKVSPDGQTMTVRLARLVRAAKCSRLLYAQHVIQQGRAFFAEICARDLEGSVAKRMSGLYREDRQGWLKVKNPTYS
jgi:ATP-dependent DNA ligase